MTLSILFLSAPWLLFFWQLKDEFLINPNYQFALFVPLLVGYLAYLRIESRPQPTSPKLPTWLMATLIGLGLLLLWPLRLLFEANADWRLIQWMQGLTTAAVTLLGLYWLGGKKYLRHFGVLALIPLLAIPWPTHFEKQISTSMMENIASVSVEVVHLVGHPAQKVGNLIALGNGVTVGVEEACSGLRSLQGNLMAAAIIGELLLLSVGARGLLFALGIGAALLFNLIRSLILVITAATQGAQPALLLHDTAGWSILLLSMVTLWGLAQLLPKQNPAKAAKAVAQPLPRMLCIIGLLVIIASEPLVSLYYPTIPSNRTPITLASPAQVGLGDEVVTNAAEDFRDMLFYDRGESWRWKDESGEWILFYFEWDNPRLSRLGGAYHSPERCLPNTGWKTTQQPTPKTLKLAQTNDELQAMLSQHKDIRRKAILLFAHWNAQGERLGDNTLLQSSGRWEDFIEHRRLGKRRALQIALISHLRPDEAQRAVEDFSQRVLVEREEPAQQKP